MAFDPIQPSRIYGIGSLSDSKELFWIDNWDPQRTQSFFKVSIPQRQNLRRLKGEF